MRHGKKVKKLGRTTPHRHAMMANMATSLLRHGQITTTTPKAKAVRSYVDRLAAKAKGADFNAWRQVARDIKDKEVLKSLFHDIVPQLQDRDGSCCRVIKAGFRKGDRAELSVVKLLAKTPEAEKKAARKEKGKKASKKKSEKKHSEKRESEESSG